MFFARNYYKVFPDDIYSYELFNSTSYLENDYLSRLKTYKKMLV